MKQLRISEDLALPVDAATQTFLVVGKRGSGKSNTAARIAEQLLDAKVPLVVFDPVDVWYGLKASRDGKGQGYGVYVFGGRHKDVDLKADTGALIAEFVCEHRAPIVLSCKHLSGLERSRFMIDFAMTLYRKWTGGVLHLVLEEAHELAPQNPPKGEKAEEMLGAFKKLWKLGRSGGIGGTAVTQRPASLSKDITTQSEILVVHRTIGPQDVEAVKQWIKYHRQGEEILSELATLKTGEAFVWGPEFPEDKPIGLRRVQVLQRETFDSASTPKAGEQREEPKDLAPVDLDRLRSKMATTMERAKAEDPRELQQTVRELRAQVAKLQAAKPAAAPAPAKGPRVVEKPVLKDAQVKRLEAAAARFERAASSLHEASTAIVSEAERHAHEIKAALAAARNAPSATPIAGRGIAALIPDRRPATQTTAPRPRPAVATTRPAPTNGGGGRETSEQRSLDTIAMLYARGLPVTREAVARWQGLHPNGGRFNRGLARLREGGYLDGFRLTERGAAEARPIETGSTALMAALPDEGHRRVMGEILAAGGPLSREELAARLSLHPNGGRYNRTLAWLRDMGAIPERGSIEATAGAHA